MTDSCYSDGEPEPQREEGQRQQNSGLHPWALTLTRHCLADSGPGGTQQDTGQKLVSHRPVGMSQMRR